MLGSPRPVGTCDARVTDNPLDREAVPHEKNNQRADCRTDRTRTLIRQKNEVWAKEFRRYANVRYLERKLMRGTTVRFLGNRFGTHASIRRPKACFFAPTGNL
jgi:hypothetical protein